MIRGGRGGDAGRLALGATLVLLLGVAVWSALTVVRLRREQDWVQHTHKVIEAITAIEAAAYSGDAERREQAIAEARALLADNASQTQWLDRLAAFARAGLASPTARDDIRTAARVMVIAEEDLLIERSQAQASTATTLEALIVAGLAGMLVALVGDFGIRRSEERRRRAEEERARLFDLSDELLCIATYDRRSELNPAWERLLGFTMEEIRSRPLAELIHPDDIEATHAAGAALLQGTAMVCYQNRLRAKDGTYRHIEMRQLLQNLIGNALKFHKKGEPPHVQVRGRIAFRPARVCEVEVEDGGIGFDEKHLERIFSVFQRLHGRSEYEGSGMGLAICRRIVERHGGTITARSKLGEGATFVVTLPAPA